MADYTRRLRRARRYYRRGRRAFKVGRGAYRLWKRTEVDMHNYSLDRYAFVGDDRLGDIERPRNSWLFSWALKPLNDAINERLFRPKRTFRRRRGPNEKEWEF
jgi:hypothetical protein